jgi:hypothetical protein
LEAAKKKQNDDPEKMKLADVLKRLETERSLREKLETYLAPTLQELRDSHLLLQCSVNFHHALALNDESTFKQIAGNYQTIWNSFVVRGNQRKDSFKAV